MPYWQLFYHLIWSTKDREPLLTDRVEPLVYGFIRSKVIGLGGTLFALNGTAEHIHVVVAIPPAISVARFVGQIKGVSSARFNQSRTSGAVFWQEEYGAFSFDAKRLPHFVAYVDHQKEHHSRGQTISALERTAAGGVQLIREAGPVYAVNERALWSELMAFTED